MGSFFAPSITEDVDATFCRNAGYRLPGEAAPNKKGIINLRHIYTFFYLKRLTLCKYKCSHYQRNTREEWKNCDQFML